MKMKDPAAIRSPITLNALINRLVRDLQPAIDNRERLAQLGFRDTKRRIREERVPTHKRVESLFAEELAQRLHLGCSAVKWRERFARLSISDQLKNSKQTNVARRAH